MYRKMYTKMNSFHFSIYDNNDNNDDVKDTILYCVDKLNEVVSFMDEDAQARASFLTE